MTLYSVIYRSEDLIKRYEAGVAIYLPNDNPTLHSLLACIRFVFYEDIK
jgi:hypothetical protein